LLDLLTRTLLLISNALLVPVILAIFGLLIWTLILCGGFVREWYERRKVSPVLDRALSALRQHRHTSEVWSGLETASSGLPRRFAAYVTGNHEDGGALDQALSLLENDVAAALARHSFITRIAPIFGLMGTLIPLGPALSGLASGNMQALSGNLIVAFTATVVGLLISGISYGMGLTRRIWYSRDMTGLEAVVEAIESHAGESHA
jgi:biopolymer transport protein ExbB/TolQ